MGMRRLEQVDNQMKITVIVCSIYIPIHTYMAHWNEKEEKFDLMCKLGMERGCCFADCLLVEVGLLTLYEMMRW